MFGITISVKSGSCLYHLTLITSASRNWQALTLIVRSMVKLAVRVSSGLRVDLATIKILWEPRVAGLTV